MDRSNLSWRGVLVKLFGSDSSEQGCDEDSISFDQAMRECNHLSMKIGIFDSGLGGLTILRSVVRRLPQYDYLYLGDTLRVPYGNRSQETIYEFTKQAVEYLFAQDCQLIILACNTASTRALRRLQREYLPAHYPDRRILGVIIPTVEAARELGAKRVGILATSATVESHAFLKEFKKLHPFAKVFQKAAPLLVPLIENNALAWSGPIVEHYLRAFRSKRIDTLILGCTHYPHLRRHIRKAIGPTIKIIAQNDLIPDKLADYLERHPEIEKTLSRHGRVKIEVTEITKASQSLCRRWFGERKHLSKILFL